MQKEREEEKGRDGKVRQRRRKRGRHCWHKMLTCQHWRSELRGGWENKTCREETEDQIGESKNEQIPMTKGCDWNWRGRGWRGISEDGGGSEEGGMGGEMAPSDASCGASYDLYVTQLQALPLCIGPSLIHNCLTSFPLSFARGHLLNGVKIKTAFHGGF